MNQPTVTGGCCERQPPSFGRCCSHTILTGPLFWRVGFAKSSYQLVPSGGFEHPGHGPHNLSALLVIIVSSLDSWNFNPSKLEGLLGGTMRCTQCYIPGLQFLHVDRTEGWGRSWTWRDDADAEPLRPERHAPVYASERRCPPYTLEG